MNYYYFGSFIDIMSRNEITSNQYNIHRLDHIEAEITPDKDWTACFNEKIANNHPGDFSSDAQFFVFTGVIAWLGATACLVIYVFFSQRYLDDDKKAPLIVSKLKNFKKLCHENI